MGALWDEHDERAFVRHAGVRPRLKPWRLPAEAVWGIGANSEGVRGGAARAASLRTALLVWASGVSISRGGIQRRFPAKSPGPSTHASQRQQAPEASTPLP